MNRSTVSKKALGLIAVILAVAATATTVFAQEEGQRSQISIQGTGLVTKSSNDQILIGWNKRGVLLLMTFLLMTSTIRAEHPQSHIVAGELQRRGDCVFRGKPSTYSDRSRPLIPIQVDQ